MKKFILIAGLSILSGCVITPNSANVYRSSQTQQEQKVRLAIVESVREVTINKGETGVGVLTGAALGGIAAGKNIGKGDGAVAAGILGAVAGGMVGQHIESNLTNRPGVEITVRLNNDELVSVVQDADASFRVGDKVRLLSNGRTTRITH